MPLLLRLLQSEQIIHSPQPANDIDQVHFLLRYKCKKDQGKRPQWLVDEIYNLVLVECTIHQTKDIERRAMFDRRAMSGRNSLFYSTPACFLLPPILLQSVLFYGTSSTLHAYSSQVDMATCTLFSLLLNTACTFFPLRSRPLPCFFVRPALLLPFFQFLSFFPAWSLLSPLDLFSTL